MSIVGAQELAELDSHYNRRRMVVSLNIYWRESTIAACSFWGLR